MDLKEIEVEAVTSTVIIPILKDGESATIEIRKLTEEEKKEVLTRIRGRQHYVFHQSTQRLLEQYGAVPAPEGQRLLKLEKGKYYLAVPLKKKDRSGIGKTIDVEIEGEGDIDGLTYRWVG